MPGCVSNTIAFLKYLVALKRAVGMSGGGLLAHYTSCSADVGVVALESRRLWEEAKLRRERRFPPRPS